jgi:TM2 domain-containing membrane protein YozV
MVCKYFSGYLLIAWEFALNNLSGLNTAIYHSMTGQIEVAKQDLNIHWILVYLPVYVFCIWDSYRLAVQYNQNYLLGFREEETQTIISKNISALEVNLLDKRKPILAIAWSLFIPGLGHFYLSRIPFVLYSILWFIVILHFSNLSDAIHFSFWGETAKATSLLNPQWLIYLPSIYGFSAYDAYVNAVEYNKLFEREQSRYLKTKYQIENSEFDFPL